MSFLSYSSHTHQVWLNLIFSSCFTVLSCQFTPYNMKVCPRYSIASLSNHPWPSRAIHCPTASSSIKDHSAPSRTIQQHPASSRTIKEQVAHSFPSHHFIKHETFENKKIIWNNKSIEIVKTKNHFLSNEASWAQRGLRWLVSKVAVPLIK